MPKDAFLHSHSVQFYGSEEALFRTVGNFVVDALGAQQPAILIITKKHEEGVLGDLRRRMIDVERARADGYLVVYDAEETLGRFMRDGSPDPILFEQSVGHLVGETVRKSPGVVIRAYGEMVDVLWQQGHQDAAMKLEFLWNKLGQRHSFALLCGYSMGSFYKLAAQLQDVCDLHTHVVEAEEAPGPVTPVN